MRICNIQLLPFRHLISLKCIVKEFINDIDFVFPGKLSLVFQVGSVVFLREINKSQNRGRCTVVLRVPGFPSIPPSGPHLVLVGPL